MREVRVPKAHELIHIIDSPYATNNQIACVPSEDSVQTWHSPCLASLHSLLKYNTGRLVMVLILDFIVHMPF